MAEAVIVTIELGPERLDAFAQLGDREGPAFAFHAPPAAVAPAFWQSDESHAIVVEILALMHLPRIDTLVIRVPRADVACASEVLPGRYAARHVVRNTECRSQTLEVSVREVVVTALADEAPAVEGTLRA